MAKEFKLIPVDEKTRMEKGIERALEEIQIKDIIDLIKSIRAHYHIEDLYECRNIIKGKRCNEELEYEDVEFIHISTTDYYVTYKCSRCGSKSSYGMMINYADLLYIKKFKEVAIK